MNLEHYLYLFVEETSPDSANNIELLQVGMNFLCHKLQTGASVHMCRWLTTQRKPTTMTSLNHMFRHAFFVFCPIVATTEGHRQKSALLHFVMSYIPPTFACFTFRERPPAGEGGSSPINGCPFRFVPL
jgi:hypothetical protein